MKHKIKRIFKRRSKKADAADANNRFDEAIQTLPRITNETVAAHREEVLSSARKYIYPLQHSKHRVVIVSATLLGAAIIGIFTYCILALYHFQSDSSFVYRVTQVIPFPVAKAGPHFVSYESYLFELRHYVHYYQTQQGVDFKSPAGKPQLQAFKRQALQEVIDDAYVKQLAAQNHVSVSDQEVDDEITLVRNQDRLGSNEKEFENVLKEFWGWSPDDFKRELKQQLLAQKVVSTLDVGTHERAQVALKELQGGMDFGKLAAVISDDAATKANGGQFGFPIGKNDQNLPPQTTNALFSLQPGQITDVVNIGTGLEIDKLDSVQGDKVQGAHILFNFQSINTYINQLSAKEKAHKFIKD